MLNISAVGRCALWLACCSKSTFFLLARLPSGALVQRCILCCVFREGVVNSFASRRKNFDFCPIAHVGQFWFHSGDCGQSRGWLHMVCLSVPKRFFFFLCDCVFFTPKSTTTDISFESKFAAAMLCFIHDDCVSFRWRGFSRGWLWGSLSFCHGECANTGCTADIGCLFILFGSMSVVTTPSLVLVRN